MKAFLTVVSICFSFIVAGESLMCEQCINYNGTNCASNLITCNANITSCENGLIQTTVDGITSYVAYKSCTQFTQCRSYFFSESIGHYQLQTQKICCTTDNCNADPIVLPPRNNTPNGVKCPFCYAENTITCKPQETINCTGLETKCVYFGGTVQKFGNIVTAVFRNCISKEYCDLNSVSLPDFTVLDVNHFSCNDGDDDKD